MGSTPESPAGSSGDMVPLELEEFEDISLLMDKPPKSMKASLWAKLKPSFQLGGMLGNRRQGFKPLETDEFNAKDGGQRWCPEEDAGPLSFLFFTYVDSLMDLGFRKPLVADDLWDLSRRDEAEGLVDSFQRNMEATIEPIKSPQGSVVRTMWKTHRARFILAGTIKFVHDVLQFMSPVILQQLLRHLEDDNTTRTERIRTGTMLAVALFCGQALQTILVNQYFHMVYRISMQLKAQLVQMLYRKSLRITSAVKSEKGVGTIANLQSNDASKLWSLPNYLHIIWSGPFQILAVMALLVRVLGWLPAFAGLMVTILLLPLNAVAGKYMVAFRKKKMGFTDSRVKLTSEVVNGIKAIKLYAWEEPYVEKITELRRVELEQLKKTGILQALNRMFFSSGPIMIAMAGFGTYTALGGSLTASIAFPALSLFQLLRFPVMMFPNQITNLINGGVALKRLQSFMESDEMDQAPPAPPVEPFSKKVAVSVRDGSFSWGTGEDLTLKDINLEALGGELVIVVGEVGSGKSSLLGAILGELHKISGKVKVAGKVSYTAQDSWIQHTTVEKNITMGKPMDDDLYADVLHSCALIDDLLLLSGGDQTEIGERGVNLSGGQKQRVALARACYSRADVVLLDDPLSAVDAHVGRHLFDECITGLLGRSTRILVTHQLQFLPSADKVVVVKNGRIVEMGTYIELKNKGVEFSEFKLRMEKEAEEDDSPSLSTKKIGVEPAVKRLPQFRKADKLRREKTKSIVKELSMKGGSNLTKSEERSVGKVKKSVYSTYLKHWGPCFLLPVLLFINKFAESGLTAIQNWWLSIWSDVSSNDIFYMQIYFSFGLSSIIFTFVGAMILLAGTLSACKQMHSNLLKKVVRLPMSFFDTQPSGRLINRFSRDTEALDGEVAPVVSMALSCAVSVAVSVLVVAAVTKIVLAPILLLAYFYIRVQRRYLATSRELKRLDSLAMSPIFAHFGESLGGLQTIRASRLQKDFSQKNEHLINLSNRANWPLVSSNRWLSIKLELMSGTIVFCTALVVAVIFRRQAGLAGLALTAALNFTGLMNWMIRQITQLEVSMNCVERLVDYHQYDSERAAIIPGQRPPANWPQNGSITVTNLWLRYRSDLDPVLKGLTFAINGREKIGLCGRTGCGKSTLMMSLFRIVEAESGSVLIDGVDTTSIGLQDLRSHLSLVPQDPIIFSGSFRGNLDPFDTVKNDSDIWGALKQAGLDTFVRNLDGGLDAEVSEGGGNMSCGQRQLLCMARALLRGSRILVLDEATSNVDNTTDSLIQETIRTAFKEYTVLTIAHRLHTILDYDRVMVLDAGELKEFDTPKNLLSNPDSMFSKLMDESTKGENDEVKHSDSTSDLLQKVQEIRDES